MEKLYVVVRGDLEPGAQLAQGLHAAIVFAVRNHALTCEWLHDSNNIVGLAAPNETALWELYARAKELGIERVAFREPDLDGQLTAIALGDGAQRLLSSLPLALRAYRSRSRQSCTSENTSTATSSAPQ